MRRTGTEDQPVVGVEHAVSTRPTHFSRNLRPVASGVSTSSGPSAKFRADVYAAPLQQTGLFTVRIQDALVERGAQPYTAITMPVSGPLEFYRKGKGESFYPGSAHILHATDPLDLRIDQARGLFVATLEQEWLDTTAKRLAHHASYQEIHEDWKLDLRTSTGRSFRHFLDFMWSELCRGGQFTRSELAVREIENTCTTLLVLASETTAGSLKDRSRAAASSRPIDLAEEYLRASLTEPYALDKLIELTGTSASTLSREFRKRHGVPPFQFLKLRRLEAAHREFVTAEPGQTTVTEVATTYGFYHPGRFSRWYRENYGESPSATLRRLP